MQLTSSLKYILLSASSLAVMSAAIVAPALPGIAAEFSDIPNAELISRIVLTLPALFIALFSPLAGKIVDQTGEKPLLLLSLLLFSIVGTTVFFIENIWLIIICRALMGVSISGVLTASTSFLVNNSHSESRSSLMSIQSAVMAFSAVLFSLMGGFLAQFSWRLPFLTFSLGIFPFLLLFKQKSPGAVTREKPSRKYPLKPVQLLILSVCFLGMSIFYLLPTRLPFFVISQLDGNAVWIGMLMAILNLTTAFSSLNYSRLRKTFSLPGIFIVMLGLMAGGYGFLVVADSLISVIVAMVIAGAGLGLLYPNVSVWLAGTSASTNKGSIMGLMTATIFSGQFLSPLLFHPLFQTQGFRGGMLVTTLILLSVMAIFIFWQPDKGKKDPE